MSNQDNQNNDQKKKDLDTILSNIKKRINTTEKKGKVKEVNREAREDDLGHKKASQKTEPAKAKSCVTKNSSPNLNLPVNQQLLPIVPIREGILFPSTESILTFGRPQSLKAISESSKYNNMVVLLTQKNPKIHNPRPSDLYTVGTLAVIEKTLKTDDSLSALARGVSRVKIMNFTQLKPTIMAQVTRLYDVTKKDPELVAMTSHLNKIFRKVVQMGKPVEFLNFMKLMSGVSEGELADQIASTLNVKTKIKQNILETIDVKSRLKKVITYLTQEIKILEIEKDVVHKTQAKFDKHMKESVLRERLKTIQKELGDIDDDEELSQEYEKRLKKAKFNDEIKKKVKKEIKRLKQMSLNNPESGYVRTWLDTIFELPWGVKDSPTIEIKESKKTLEKNHYGLKDVKDRILEYLAVMQLKQKNKAKEKERTPTILCFVGPPGVGKTSIGKSIAEALGRKFTKISLGGIRDEAEIRGHRRTYVGAMPGRIIKGILQAKSSNPVFILDEVDKIGKDFRGDPSAALLEVLDPEQNKIFEDHYLDLPFDLSDIIFITTANTLATIPPALKDRLEIIRYPGYTYEEKFNIAKKHLLDRITKANGLKKTQVKLPDNILKAIIQRYTREAGVRDLERNLGRVMRKLARKVVESQKDKTKNVITQKSLKDFLGPEKFDITFAEKKNQVGLSTGLAWTSVGGDVLFIEVALTPGKGKVILTGKLGDVMKESAQAALTYVKANAKKLGIKNEKINKSDIHVHVPEGAVPKDGPSAGITITTAMVSAFTNKKVKRTIAMTGEVTLRGRVLRIGGLKEKAIAAHRAGCKTIIIPKDNKRDLVEIPQTVKDDIKFKPVENVAEVLKLALKK